MIKPLPLSGSEVSPGLPLLYAYGLSDEASAEAVAGELGVGGARVYLLEGEENLRAVVSEFTGARVAASAEYLKAHNLVLARVLAETTPLPFRFGTLASAVQLAAYMKEHRAQLLESLERVRGCVEMSVKILWNAEAARSPPETHTNEAEDDAGDLASQASPGRAYLEARRRELRAGEAQEREAQALAAWLAAHVCDVVRDSRVEVRPRERLVLRAAHLVVRGRAGEYRERVRAARRERRSLSFLTSGMWPPYSFSRVSS